MKALSGVLWPLAIILGPISVGAPLIVVWTVRPWWVRFSRKHPAQSSDRELSVKVGPITITDQPAPPTN